MHMHMHARPSHCSPFARARDCVIAYRRAGAMTALHVGGVLDRWEFVLAGPPMEQVNTAEPLAASGQTCLSEEAWRHVRATPRCRLVAPLPSSRACVGVHV